mmetsp:Transcript_8277/g.14834  ORF Transcript_8277/g.14834 Transcript_8277/m.14834 type:complete len:159 (+) Transcript_8277:47-523(+)
MSLDPVDAEIMLNTFSIADSCITADVMDPMVRSNMQKKMLVLELRRQVQDLEAKLRSTELSRKSLEDELLAQERCIDSSYEQVGQLGWCTDKEKGRIDERIRAGKRSRGAIFSKLRSDDSNMDAIRWEVQKMNREIWKELASIRRMQIPGSKRRRLVA